MLTSMLFPEMSITELLVNLWFIFFVINVTVMVFIERKICKAGLGEESDVDKALWVLLLAMPLGPFFWVLVFAGIVANYLRQRSDE